MSVKRVIWSGFWIDSYVMDNYSVEDKYFYLYLLTSPKSTQVGIYSLPLKMMSFETGYSLETLKVLLDRFQNQYKEIIYSEKTQEITILNSLKFSVLKGGKPVMDLLSRELTQVQDLDLINKTYQHLSDWWDQSRRNFDRTIKQVFETEILRRQGSIHELNQNHYQNSHQNQEQIHHHYQNHHQDSYHESSNESSARFDPFILEFYSANIGKLNSSIETDLRMWAMVFESVIIFEALVRSTKAKNPMAYANTILATWRRQGVESLEDIKKLDEEHKQEQV